MDRKRSRSSSRSRSPRRKHRKFQHRRHSRRSRSRDSRSRSRSGGRPTTSQRIHVNPAFGIGPPSLPPTVQMGYSASQILQHNNFLESEVMRLKNALLAEQGSKQIEISRANMLNQEMRNVVIQRDQAQKQYNEVVNERRMMIEMKTEMSNRMAQMDVANRKLRDELNEANRRFDAKNQEIRGLHYQADIVQKQIAAINDRNATLKAKCEAMVAQNRRQQEEIDAKQKCVETARLNVQKAETDFHLADIEIKRLVRELETSRSMENTRQDDRISLEAALARKNDEFRVAAYKSQTALRAANETIEKLENRLKTEKPAQHDELAVFQETIYVAIETMRSAYEKQLSRLEREVEALKAERLREEPQEQVQVEELPEYLQTPRKPDPAKMDGLIRTKQVRIDVKPTDRAARATSGPPVDMPITWHLQKMMSGQEVPHSSSLTLFGTAETKQEPSETLHVAVNQRQEVFDEDDLLTANSDEMISPSQNLELIEQQLLGDDHN